MNLSWIGFVVSGLLGAATIWIAQRHKVKPVVRLLCVGLAVGALIVTLYLQQAPRTLGGPTPWYDSESVQNAGFFLLMLLGMAARYLTRAIEVRREKIAAMVKIGGDFKKPSIEFDLWEFSYPLFISVITFGVLLSQLDTHVMSIANSVLSFQTGFFGRLCLLPSRKRAADRRALSLSISRAALRKPTWFRWSRRSKGFV